MTLRARRARDQDWADCVRRSRRRSGSTITNISRKLGLKGAPAANREELREAERQFERGLGLLAEVLHARLDESVEEWGVRLENLVARGVPSDPRASDFWLIASLLTMIEHAPRLHEVYDRLVENGKLDGTPLAEVEAKRAAFARMATAISLAEEADEVAALEAEATSRRAGFDSRLEEARQS